MVVQDHHISCYWCWAVWAQTLSPQMPRTIRRSARLHAKINRHFTPDLCPRVGDQIASPITGNSTINDFIPIQSSVHIIRHELFVPRDNHILFILIDCILAALFYFIIIYLVTAEGRIPYDWLKVFIIHSYWYYRCRIDLPCLLLVNIEILILAPPSRLVKGRASLVKTVLQRTVPWNNKTRPSSVVLTNTLSVLFQQK